MKRYIVTEEELQELVASRLDWQDTAIAEAACRSRPVPEWATHFAGDLVSGCEFMQAEEIP